MVATDYFTTRSGNWWPIEVILGGSFQGHVADTLSINFYKFLLVKPSLKPVLFHCGSSSFSPYTLQGQSDTSVALYSVFFFRSEPGSATVIGFVRRLVSIPRLQVANSRHAVVNGVPPARCMGTRTSRAVRWRAGTSRLLQRFWNALLFPRFFRQPKPRQKYTQDLQNLSNIKFIGISVDFAHFSELRKKHLHLLSL